MSVSNLSNLSYSQAVSPALKNPHIGGLTSLWLVRVFVPYGIGREEVSGVAESFGDVPLRLAQIGYAGFRTPIQAISAFQSRLGYRLDAVAVTEVLPVAMAAAECVTARLGASAISVSAGL